MRPTVLVSEIDDVLRERLVRALRERNYEVTGTAYVEQALRLAEQQTPEYALFDLQEREHAGLTNVRRLHALDAKIL